MKRVLALMLILVLCVSNISYAWPDRDRGWGHRDGYRYHDGGWWVGGALVGGLALGAIIASLPPRVTYVNGYYYDGTYYYQQTPDGYVVVEPSVVVSIPPDFQPVQWRGTTYYTRDNRWYIVTTSGLVQIENPIH